MAARSASSTTAPLTAPAITQNTKKPAYSRNNFTSKNDLLAWINDLLKVDLTLVEQLGSGTMYCQIFDVIHAGSIPLAKVKWTAKLEYDFLHNFKLLQSGFDKLQIVKSIPVNKLAKARYQDNLEFAQWMKAYFDFNCKDKGKGYDALKRRSGAAPYFGFCKGGVLPSKTLFYRNPNEKFSLDDFSNSSMSEHDMLDDDSLSMPLRPNIPSSGQSSRSESVSKQSPNFTSILSPIKASLMPENSLFLQNETQQQQQKNQEIEEEEVLNEQRQNKEFNDDKIIQEELNGIRNQNQLFPAFSNELLNEKREKFYESILGKSNQKKKTSDEFCEQIATSPQSSQSSGEKKDRMNDVSTNSSSNSNSNNNSGTKDYSSHKILTEQVSAVQVQSEKQLRSQEFLNRINAKKQSMAAAAALATSNSSLSTSSIPINSTITSSTTGTTAAAAAAAAITGTTNSQLTPTATVISPTTVMSTAPVAAVNPINNISPITPSVPTTTNTLNILLNQQTSKLTTSPPQNQSTNISTSSPLTPNATNVIIVPATKIPQPIADILPSLNKAVSAPSAILIDQKPNSQTQTSTTSTRMIIEEQVKPQSAVSTVTAMTTTTGSSAAAAAAAAAATLPIAAKPTTNVTTTSSVSTYATMTANLISRIQEITNATSFQAIAKKPSQEIPIVNSGVSNTTSNDAMKPKSLQQIPLSTPSISASSSSSISTSISSSMPIISEGIKSQLSGLSRTVSAPTNSNSSASALNVQVPAAKTLVSAGTVTKTNQSATISRVESLGVSEYETPLMKRFKSEQSDGMKIAINTTTNSNNGMNENQETKKRPRKHSSELVVGTIKDIIARGATDYDSIVDRIRLYMFQQQTFE